jgi:HD-like signal output (HDOD) protein
MDTTVLELIKKSAAIPSIPQVATRFLEIIQDPEFEYREIVEVLSTDPGAASEILRLANSALFGVTRQVTSLQQALTLLGIKRVRSLVLGRYIVDSINRKTGGTIDRSYYWRRSVTAAVLAARLADALLPRQREEAFMSGLLADVGVIVLDDVLPERYRPVAEEYRPEGAPYPARTEESLLDTHHGEVSGLIFEHWQLPEIICSAVRNHPWELQAESNAEPLARLIGAADLIAKYLCEQPRDMQPILDHFREISRVLNIESDALACMLDDIETQIEEFAEILRIDVIPSEVYELIAQQVREKLVAETAAA